MNLAGLDEQTLALLGNLQTTCFINALHFTGDIPLIHKIMKSISYRKIPYTIDFNKILKQPKDLYESHGSELQYVYAYLTIASPFTKVEWYPERYSKIEKYDEETFKTVYQTVSTTPGFEPERLKIFTHREIDWLKLDNENNYELVLLGKKCVESLIKYGATDDDWCKKNWGAHWGGQTPIPTYTGNCDTLIFKTNGGDIQPLVNILSKTHLHIKIEYLWADDKFSDCCGKYTYCNGEETGITTNVNDGCSIVNEIINDYLKGYTHFDYDDSKEDYVLYGKNVGQTTLFELMCEHDALTTYDGHPYDYDKYILP